jgi:hypothetical protein
LEFAFEVPEGLTVRDVLSFSKEEALGKITAVDDDGNPVNQVPTDQTSDCLHLDFLGETFRIPSFTGVLPVAGFVTTVARFLLDISRERSALLWKMWPEDRILSLMFYRFYYSEDQKCWTLSFDPGE